MMIASLTEYERQGTVRVSRQSRSGHSLASPLAPRTAKVRFASASSAACAMGYALIMTWMTYR